MKKIFIVTLICLSLSLVACGKKSNASNKAPKNHFFDQPYECTHESEVTSKRTGKTRVVKYRSYYSPKKDWRIDLTDVESDKAALGGRGIANLYTPSSRYDGAYRETDKVVTRVKYSSAWPRKNVSEGISFANLSKKKKKNCKIMSDTSIFDINYLDTLEVMGQ